MILFEKKKKKYLCVLCVSAAGLVSLHGRLVHAQERPAGSFTLTLDRFPNTDPSSTELRARLFGEHRLRPSERVTIHLAGFIEGLVDRDRGERSRDATARVQEASIEVAGARADFRAGYSRVVWGRLDEIQPTDVVNPLDLARFFFEGRSEARMPVAMARGRVFFGERATIDAVLVPGFRPATFDQVDEESSPFNLLADRVVCLGAGPERVCAPVLTDVREPATSFGNVQGGARVSATTGRVDWAVAFWRGFDTVGAYELAPPTLPAPGEPLAALRTFPRFTMVGGDIETARGPWTFRGEIAAAFASRASGALTPAGDADRLDAGIGFDRRAGEYHVSGTVLLQHDFAVSTPDALLPASTSTSLVSSVDRTFARERYRTRGFVVYNLDENTAFARNITSMEVRGNVSLEGSVGWFFGTDDPPLSRNIIARFSDRDFWYLRFRIHF